MLEHEVREIRMLFWNRILQGNPPEIHEIDEALLPLTRDADIESRLAFTLLRASAEIAKSGTETMQRNLRVALLCWFSGSVAEAYTTMYHRTIPQQPYIHEILNRKMTWHEAASIVGANPNDYTARHRLMKRLKEGCVLHWVRVFGGGTGNPFEAASSHA